MEQQRSRNEDKRRRGNEERQRHCQRCENAAFAAPPRFKNRQSDKLSIGGQSARIRGQKTKKLITKKLKNSKPNTSLVTYLHKLRPITQTTFTMQKIAITCCLLLITVFSFGQQSREKQIDSMLNKTFPAKGSGATAIIAQKGQILYHKAFGMADLENNIPMRIEMVFRIGSISKQFTAVAILKLMEEGKLSLQDEITKYIPDYPTQGNKVTIEHLLTHTSGILSYTNMAKFGSELMARDMKPTELIDVFKNEKFEFAPGEKWNYNNSGYFLLGYIIEKITGMTYADFIEKTIFKPLGMKSSLYGSNSKLIPNRAQGYEPGPTGIQNATYLSMTLPYAAGSLMSTVNDCYIWNKAINEGKIIKKETLEKAFTPYILNSGKKVNYGYGWSIGEVNGQKVVQHSGGINGFLTNGIYVPSQDLYIAVFSNSNAIAPIEVSQRMTYEVLGLNKPKTVIKMDSLKAKEYLGVYETEEGDLRQISWVKGKLQSQRLGSTVFEIFAYDKDKFFFQNSPTELNFVRDAKGAIIGLTTKNLTDAPTMWKPTKKPFEAARKEIKIDEAILKTYEGEYEISSNLILKISVDKGQLKVSPTGQPTFDLFPESETKFFLKVVNAQIQFFKNDKGEVNRLVLYQGGQEMEGKRISK